MGEPPHAQIECDLSCRSQLYPKMFVVDTYPPGGTVAVIDADFGEFVLAEGSGLDQHRVAFDGIRVYER